MLVFASSIFSATGSMTEREVGTSSCRGGSGSCFGSGAFARVGDCGWVGGVVFVGRHDVT